jgi:hypothetical protein
MDGQVSPPSTSAPMSGATTLEPPSGDAPPSDTSEVVEDEEGSISGRPWWWLGSDADYPGDEEAKRRLQLWVGITVCVGCALYVFWVCHPELIFRNTTPTGGDMGAHVWGPAYLRDHLLPNLRLTGWSPDWYAGFPAFEFYMVIPSLAIVILDVGFLPWWLLPVVAVAAGWLGVQIHRRVRNKPLMWVAEVTLVLLALLSVNIPYNVAFKVVAVSGVISLPACVWYFARGIPLRFGGPELMAIATLPFLVDETLFHIYGGNIASTFAGEFAFSISLSLCFLFLGVVARGLRHGRNAGWASVLFALCALCHVIPFFFACLGAALLFVLRPGVKRLQWMAVAAVPGGLMALWWYLPFLWNSAYMNDMGWEKLGPLPDQAGVKHDNLTEYLRYLLPFAPHKQDSGTIVQDPNMLHGKVFFVLAVVGAILSLVLMVRAGIYLTIMTAVSALAFWLMPQARFWNARVLPFYYLFVYLLAALGIWLAIRAIFLIAVGDWVHPPDWVAVTAIGMVALIVLVTLNMSMRWLPGGKEITKADGTPAYQWGPFTASYVGPTRGWAAWNLSGYEDQKSDANPSGKSWLEFKALIDTMKKVGATNGCGRSLWEYGDFLNNYGTPMAPMLLPYFTDGCIGSQEAVYFESSSTTPFHFIMQDELSKQCSCAQRFDIFGVDPAPYHGFDLDQGIDHLQMLGVRYYLAYTDQAKAAADASPRLRKIAESHPAKGPPGAGDLKSWSVYEVEGVNLAEGLPNLPAVWTNVKDNIHSWAKPAVDWFEHKNEWNVQRSSSGPSNWPRLAFSAGKQPKVVRVSHPAKVTNIKEGRDSITFDVDQVGKPVVVRTSYFPNWVADGAEGPYRVAPNQMVVVPTSKHVVLSYSRSPIELFSMLLSLIGLALIFVFYRWWNPGSWTSREWIGDQLYPVRGRRAADGDGAGDDTADGGGDDIDSGQGVIDVAADEPVESVGAVEPVGASTLADLQPSAPPVPPSTPIDPTNEPDRGGAGSTEAT